MTEIQSPFRYCFTETSSSLVFCVRADDASYPFVKLQPRLVFHRDDPLPRRFRTVDVSRAIDRRLTLYTEIISATL